jgi:hypothetical protein
MKKLTACFMALLLISCSDADQVSLPTQAALSTDKLTFLRFSDAAYSAADKTASFWAVPGEARQIVLRYADDGAEFMRFEVGPNSLVTSDSVLISVAVDAQGAFTFHFSPSGLKFNPSAPARLLLDYTRVNADVDANGQANQYDAMLLARGQIWKRELPGLPWMGLPSLDLMDRTEAVDVLDFTSFGMAVD